MRASSESRRHESSRNRRVESNARRWRESRPVLPLAFVLFVTCLCLVSCEDDNPTPALVPDLQNVWPHEDGRYWVFGMELNTWAHSTTPYAAPELVPAAPSLDEAVELLQSTIETPVVFTDEHTYRMQFDGMATTDTGVQGKNLVGYLDDQPVPTTLLAEATGVSSGLLAQVWRARPDLHTGLLKVARAESFLQAVTDTFEIVPLSPTFLPWGVWEQGEDWIGLYGDLDQDLSWKYLEGNLTPGHEFTLQLLKVVANDVFLHARVTRRTSVQTSHATYPDALEVVYLVDFGVSELTDPNGETLGFVRYFSVGAVAYVPQVGPVCSVERGLYLVGDTQPSDPLLGLTVDLQEQGLAR